MMYMIAFPAEIQAQQLLEPYGYAHIVVPRPEGQTWDDYAWNQGNAMMSGCKIITGYTNGTDGLGNPARIPVYDTQWFWVSLLSRAADGDLWARFSGQPMIEWDFTRPPATPVKPSNFVSRAVHLAWSVDALKGISPVWAGTPNLGFPYDSA